MPKNTKKRRLPKFSKLGKYFKFKKPSKGKKNQETTEVQNGGQSTPTCDPEYTKILDTLPDEMAGTSTIKLREDKESIGEQLKSDVSILKENIRDQTDEGSVAIDAFDDQHVADNTSLNAVMHEAGEITTADIVVHSSLEEILHQENNAESKESYFSQPETKTEISNVIDNTTPESEQDVEDYPVELVYPVVIKAPFQKQKSEVDIEVLESSSNIEDHNVQSNGLQCKPCTVVVHTPVKKQLINGLDAVDPVAKPAVDKDDDNDGDDIVLMEMPQTPLQPKPHNRASKRISTVKKIRSIITTPYKRIKRDSSSLMDGHTYRYIEIQSLVNAFQTLHPCKSGMMACNEKGLQYGKSSVLRIECRDCSVKVFLQAAKC